MKHLLMSAAAVALLAACGGNKEEKAAKDAEKAVAEAVEKAADIKVRSGNASEASAALTALSLNSSGDGRVAFADKSVSGASASFTDVTITVEDDETPLKIGTLTFDGLETEDNGAANFGRMLMSGLSVTPEEDDSNAAMTINSIELVNPTPETAAWVASLLGQGEPAEFPAGAAFGFDSWTMDDLSVVIDEEDEQGTFGIAKIALNSLANEKAGSAVLSGMKLDMTDADEGMDVNFNLDSVSIKGADLKLLSALQEAGDDEDELASAIMDTMYDNPVDPGFDSMLLSNMTANVSGANFALPSLNYVVDRNRDGEPTKLSVKPFTATITADADAGEAGSELAGALGMIGYETIELSAAGVTDYDPDKDIVSYKADDNYFTLKDGFTMKFGGKLEGYKAYSESLADNMSPEALGAAASPDFMMDAFSQLTVHGFEMSFEDDSFVDRMFNLAAAQSGEDPQQMRNQVVAMMSMAPMMAAGSGVDMELVTEATSALSSFISDPKTLTIKVAPQEPLAVGALVESGDPSGLTKEALGFSATNK